MILLDMNIQFINYISGESQLIGAKYSAADQSLSVSQYSDCNSRKSVNSAKSWWTDLLPSPEDSQKLDATRNFLDLSPFLESLRDGKIGQDQGPWPLPFAIAQKRFAPKQGSNSKMSSSENDSSEEDQ